MGHKSGALLVCAGLFIATIQSADAITLGREGSGADLELKAGADIEHLHPDFEPVLPIIVETWRNCSAPTPVITSGNDDPEVHRPGSYHGKWRAIDLRGKSLSEKQRWCIHDRLTQMLADLPGRRWVLLWEEFGAGSPRNHFHLHVI